MARRKKGLDSEWPSNGSDELTEEARFGQRKEIIQNVCRDLSALEAERKTLGEQIRELKSKRIKGDLGMKLLDFAAVYRVYKMEDEDRDKFLDTLREGFQALGIGEQGSFFGVFDQSAEDATTGAS